MLCSFCKTCEQDRSQITSRMIWGFYKLWLKYNICDCDQQTASAGELDIDSVLDFKFTFMFTRGCSSEKNQCHTWQMSEKSSRVLFCVNQLCRIIPFFQENHTWFSYAGSMNGFQALLGQLQYIERGCFYESKFIFNFSHNWTCAPFLRIAYILPAQKKKHLDWNKQMLKSRIGSLQQ